MGGYRYAILSNSRETPTAVSKKKKAPFAFRGTKMKSGCFCFEGVYFSVTFHQRNTAVVYLRVCGHGCGLHVRLVCGLGRDAQR